MTREHFDNLGILRAHLIANSAQISPGLDFRVYESGAESANHCQTVGCIIGHATYIPELVKYLKFDEKGKKQYSEFGETVFGIPVYKPISKYRYEYNPVWLELFGERNINSIEHFITRLDKYIAETGVTE